MDPNGDLNSDKPGSGIADEGVTPPQHSHKRLSQDSTSQRPFKRQKGSFNADYLELLNRDIDDAVHRVCLDDKFDLPPTEVGLTTWSALEKRLFFEAIARLGCLDLSGIASRITSKSIVEVRQYIDFLDEARDLRRRDRGSFLEVAEYPAAVELSEPCCHAQEQAADAISLLQEHRETQREEKKWGCNWNITPKVASKLERGGDDTDQSPPFTQLFHLRRWLKLSGRIFMNSSVPDGNWTFIDDVPPSVWATTFNDFHSLVVSLTKRLVQTTLIISTSRIRDKKELVPKTSGVVRKRDVEAAVASLGMSPNTQQFWNKSARRLRLNVVQDEDSDEEPLTYNQIESLLVDEGDEDIPIEVDTITPKVVSDHDQDGDLSDDSLGDLSDDSLSDPSNDCSEGEKSDSSSARRALKPSIAIERRQEEQAQRYDEHASYKAEVDMWDVLQTKPPMEIPKRQEPGPLERSNVDVESPVKRDWKSQLKYHSEWETSGR